MSGKYLSEHVQTKLRNMNVITENEVVEKVGDLFIATNVLTNEKRKVSVDLNVIESSSQISEKRVLKG
tara:strand:- start:1281 stop:1484 length:204 start_codon:yes stop_codon:yes gene_type:complete